jgi:putative nucleotidyltransferase with HDIG domain
MSERIAAQPAARRKPIAQFLPAMGLFRWIQGLLSTRRSAPPQRASRSAPSHREGSLAHAPLAPLPRREPEPARAQPTGVGCLDRDEHLTVVLACPEQDVLIRLGERIARQDFDLPPMPPTSLAAIEAANRPSTEIVALVGLIERDPFLSSELLKTANSAFYATAVPVGSLHDAVMRLGLRAVRGVVFSVAMRSSILNGRGLAQYAEEVWRQSQSVARVARAIARPLGFEPEQAYVLGLLHDVGKVALLGMLRGDAKSANEITPALVGRVFHTYHELAGASMARAWQLPDEIVSVAGKHHDFAGNTTHARSAAFVNLAHKLDLFLALDDAAGFRALAQAPMFDQLATPEANRWRALELAREAWSEPQANAA